MKRYTDEVLVIYDSDEAGVKAALRAIPMLKGVGLTTRVVNLRPYKDPMSLSSTRLRSVRKTSGRGGEQRFV